MKKIILIIFTLLSFGTNIIAQAANYKVPKVITPNNDGKDDIFLLEGDIKPIAKFSLQILNRWGELLFETKQVTEGWSGQQNNKAKLLPQGTYVYLIKITDINGNEEKLQGNVTLLY
jgi:gliding motility-associated-like protein